MEYVLFVIKSKIYSSFYVVRLYGMLVVFYYCDKMVEEVILKREDLCWFLVLVVLVYC